MVKKLLDFIVLMLIWVALTWSLALPDIIAGVVVTSIIILIFSDLIPMEINYLLNPKRMFWALVYIPAFIWQVIKSNFDVAYRVFHPEMPIRPGIVKVKTTLKSEIGKTFLANSITLTPGTLTIDCIGNDLYIHWINIISDDPEEETRLIVSKFEKYLKIIFE
jgi:multicomponent Na+:H+ antiporter subunit E